MLGDKAIKSICSPPRLPDAELGLVDGTASGPALLPTRVDVEVRCHIDLRTMCGLRSFRPRDRPAGAGTFGSRRSTRRRCCRPHTVRRRSPSPAGGRRQDRPHVASPFVPPSVRVLGIVLRYRQWSPTNCRIAICSRAIPWIGAHRSRGPDRCRYEEENQDRGTAIGWVGHPVTAGSDRRGARSDRPVGRHWSAMAAAAADSVAASAGRAGRSACRTSVVARWTRRDRPGLRG